jgi:REP element-mobilizing transposase RayT
MEGMPDHVHLLLDVNLHIGIAKIVGQIKGYNGAPAAHSVSLAEDALALTVDEVEVHCHGGRCHAGSRQPLH